MMFFNLTYIKLKNSPKRRVHGIEGDPSTHKDIILFKLIVL